MNTKQKITDDSSLSLPKGWKWVKLKEICEVVTGTTPPKSDLTNYGNDVPFFKPPHLWDGQISNTEEMLSFKGAEKARVVPQNTVLVTCIGNLGRTGFVKKKAAFNQQINAILENKKIDGKYIFYQAQSPYFKSQLEKLATGTTVSIVNKGNFETIIIPLPPLPTQQLIVSKIEELFSELDKGIENLKTAQQQLKTYRQAVLKWAFEGKLTNKNVKDGELPKGWKWVQLGEVCHNVEYGSGTKSQKVGKIPVLRMGNIQNGRFDWDDLVFSDDDVEIKKYLLKKNDVLFNRTNSAELVGKTAIYKGERPAIFAGYLIRINRIETLLDADFLTYFLNTHFARSYGNTVRSFGVNQSNINGTKLKTYPLPLPKLEEQNLIVQEIESRLSVADKMEESINQSLQQAEALRQSILKQAFEGKLVIEKKEKIVKPENIYFYQMQVLALISKASKEKNISHGEMTIAKYSYLLDKIYAIPTYYNYERWHLGPYPPDMKKAIKNKEFFAINNGIEILNLEVLLQNENPFSEKIINAVGELSQIFSHYYGQKRSKKTELLATVCKVIEDIQSVDLKRVRKSMMEWKINLKTTRKKSKAEKFNNKETKKCLEFIIKQGWDKKLIKN